MKANTDKTFATALKEFNRLEGVDDDPARMQTIPDLVFIAQFEIDHFEEGESELTARQVAPIRRFVKKWEARGRQSDKEASK